MKIIETAYYLPNNEITSSELEKKLNLEDGFIEKRTGILKRFYVQEETIEDMAINVAKDLIKDVEVKDKIGFIIVATTTPHSYMPGISNYVQKYLNIENCNCYDILAGCNGFVTALDIANMYLKTNQAEMGIVIGVDILSKFTDEKDVSTSIILSDGAGAFLVSKDDSKLFESVIYSKGENNDILVCEDGNKIFMNGKEIYKYAVTETVKAVKTILKKTKIDIEEINFVVPHQSNEKIMKAISSRLKLPDNKMYMNIENVGNTFCASIPIAVSYMRKENLINEGDKFLLLGYGGGLNTGCVLLEY